MLKVFNPLHPNIFSDTDMPENSLTSQMNRKSADAGKAILEEFAKVTQTPGKASEALLMKILFDNKDTEYGRKYHFADIHSIEEYQKTVPVITYEAIEPSIERMKAGEKNILTAYPFRHMNLTSGTIGKKKSIPMTEPQAAVFMKYSNQYAFGLMAEYLDPEWMNARSFTPLEGNHETLPCGITLGCSSSIIAEAVKGGFEPYSSMLKALYTSPAEAMTPGPGINTRYMHIRFALMERDLNGISGGFMSNIVHLMTYLHDNYEMLINDIEKGTIDESVQMPETTRKSLLAKIQPMPKRAAELREVFKNGADFCFMPEIWPKMQYIYAAGGDGFSVYADTLKEQFHGGKIHHIYSGVTASEGLWSVPAGIDDTTSVLVPDSAFMEFQPVEFGDDFSHLTTIDNLEEGKIYELVITNLCGFYRYRMGDAVKVTGFYNNTPAIEFMYRVNKTVNLVGEKTNEFMLRLTAKETAKELGFSLFDYEIYPDTSAVPGKYIVMLETYDEKRFSISKEKLDRVVFEKLCQANDVYKECFGNNLIQAPDAYFEQPETQLLYRDKMIHLGAPSAQIKPVHIIGNEDEKNFFLIMRETG